MDDELLVRAMPRRPLYALRGFIARIDLAVLTAIDSEGWFATRSAIAADIDCKEVRIAVLVLRPGRGGAEVLCDDDGGFARQADVGPETEGLAALRGVAKAAAERALGAPVSGVELAGYLNEDADPALRHVFVLAYRARAAEGAVAPAGCTWRSVAGLAASSGSLSAHLVGALA